MNESKELQGSYHERDCLKVLSIIILKVRKNFLRRLLIIYCLHRCILTLICILKVLCMSFIMHV
jgi:hypothetical protein